MSELAKTLVNFAVHYFKQTTMSNINDILAKLEFAQIGWVVPDINTAVKFLEKSLGIGFPKVERYDAEELKIKYYGKIVPHEGLTTQTYNGGAFVELIQPLSDQSLLKFFGWRAIEQMEKSA
jgi:hypothetical protein